MQKAVPLMRKQSGLWQDNKTRPGSRLNPVLLQPWPGLLPVAPETPSGPSLYGAWDGREDPALPALGCSWPSHQPGPHRALVTGQNQPGHGSLRAAVTMFPKVTFQPQMPRGLGLSSQGLGVFEREGFSYLQGSGHVASSPRMPALPICSLYKH